MGTEERLADGRYRSIGTAVGGVRLSYFQRYMLVGDHMDWKTQQTPFELGMPGEWWSNVLNALVVPVERLDPFKVLVHRHPKGYEIVFLNYSLLSSDLLMTACVVRDYLDG